MDARLWRRAAGIVVLAVVAAACGTSSSNKSADNGSAAPDRTGTAGNTASARGVAADTIKIGVSYPDLEALAKTGLLKISNGDYKAITEAIVDAVNASGGINGRKLDATIQGFSVLGAAEQTATCTKFTQDVKVFAVLGGFLNDANLCVSKQYGTILVSGYGTGFNQATVSQAKAPWVTWNASDERASKALVQLSDQQGLLKDKLIGVYSQTSTSKPILDVVVKELESRGYTVTASALNDVDATDGQAFAAQEKLLGQKLKDKGVDTVFFVGGTPTVANWEAVKFYPQIFVPQTGLITPAAFTNGDAMAKFPIVAGVAASGDPNQGYDSAPMKQCRAAYQNATGNVVKTPTEETKAGKSSGFAAMQQICSAMTIFVEAAKKAGPNLTNETWKAALESLGTIELPATPQASFAPNKPDAQDSFHLMQHDPKWKPNGPINEFIPLGQPITLSS